MADEGELVAERYRVLARVGQGAMGVVWRAEDERLRREVALKQVWLPAGADDQARDRAHRQVFREARMIARLHHPHAITVYDVVEHDDRPWLVMEYLASRSLAEVLVADGPLEPERVARIGRQVADALVAAHQAGIVHRDVKPGNVLIADDGLAKVTDFGIARAVDDVTLTSTGMMAGTPAYLAPEVARGAAADFPSDVYSLGSTLYAALEGAPPFGTGDNPLAVLHRVASGEYAPPTPRGPITPLVEALLRPAPAERPDMRRVRDDLARLVAAEAGTEEGPVTPVLARPEPAPDPVSPSSPHPTPTSHPQATPEAWRDPTPTPPPSAPATAPTTAPTTAPAPEPHRAPAPVQVAVTSSPASSGSSPAPAPAAAPSSPGPSAPSAEPAEPAPGRHGPPNGAVAAPTTAPATRPATRPGTRPAATAPVGAPDPDESGESERGRRWPWVVAAAVVVAVVAVIAVAALLSTTADRPGASVPGSTAAPEAGDPTGSGAASPDAAGGSGAGGGSSSAGAGLTGSPEDQARQQAVIDYYGLIPGRLDEGWERLTPSFQQGTAGGFDGYRRFWGTISQVTVRGVSPAGGNEVDATVTYRYADGREVDERTVFRLAFADGIWKIDGQRQAGG
ncbi:serine/threonine-protein kinase [Actinomycetospora lemnae]|uniref:non-specific serine/threonine protein kinase n=1 Tax=Actinomycetospora lemnae TaxID=3019891 RepID=A0ABT5SYZ4_9PSEU|nr:serine/threonine-protein kinase [Actinomycetospora sp. DW7H6]MDD7967217.1 serine/threonine-protein kinase [Actinomycetospora sp. DW7H6]